MHTYNYVGDGAGVFSKEATIEKTDWGKTVKQICQGFMVVLGLAGVAYIAYLLLLPSPDEDMSAASTKGSGNSSEAPGGSPGTAPPTVRTTAPLTSAAFDCEAAFFNWRRAWSQKKREWCCNRFGRGCTPPPPQGADSNATGSWHYNCSAGFTHWKEGWSDEKKVWCCQHHDKGCPRPVVAHALGPRAQKQQQQRQKQREREQQQPIRQQHKQGQPSQQQPLYDCKGDPWGNEWHVNERVFCCLHEQLGCPTSEPAQRAPASSTPEPASASRQDNASRSRPTVLTPLPVLAHMPVPVPTAASAPNSQGCDASCTMRGVSKSCRFLVKFAAEHTFSDRLDGCELSLAVVRTQCSSCLGCNIADTHCHLATSTAAPHQAKRRLQASQLPEDALRQRCQQACTSESCSTGRWSALDTAWCCKHEGLGCTVIVQ